MKILYTCTYSAGISGVWNRVYNLALEMVKKGHEVYVFSSNLEAGTLKKVKDYENVDGINIFRFNVKQIGSKNAFDFSISAEKMRERLKEIMPDVVDCQTYRHSEGNIISKECGKLGIPCFLTTHAPFVDFFFRGFLLGSFAFFYDVFVGRKILKRFKKIIAITKWEYPYLSRLGVSKEKIVYSPNGIPSEFFSIKRRDGRKNEVLFFGRVSAVKNIETLVKAAKILNEKGIKLELRIVGPVDSDYGKEIKKRVEKDRIKNIKFHPAVYNLKEKIKVYDNCKIFVLPSKREGMPQALIEAMSRGKVVVASDIPACKELVSNCKNGFTFPLGNASALALKIESCLKAYDKLGNVRKSAVKFASGFKWRDIVDELERVYRNRQ